jgi:hypothetical protein
VRDCDLENPRPDPEDVGDKDDDGDKPTWAAGFSSEEGGDGSEAWRWKIFFELWLFDDPPFGGGGTGAELGSTGTGCLLCGSPYSNGVLYMPLFFAGPRIRFAPPPPPLTP